MWSNGGKHEGYIAASIPSISMFFGKGHQCKSVSLLKRIALEEDNGKNQYI